MGGATLSRAGDSVVMGDLPDGDGAWGYGVAVMGQPMVDARECVRASRQSPRHEVFLRMSVDSREGDVFVGLVSEEYVRRTQIVDTPHAEPCLCGYERDHTWAMPLSTRRGCSRSNKQCMACAGCGCCGCSSGVSHQQAQALFGDCTRGGDAALLAGWFAASPGGWGCVSGCCKLMCSAACTCQLGYAFWVTSTGMMGCLGHPSPGAPRSEPT